MKKFFPILLFLFIAACSTLEEEPRTRAKVSFIKKPRTAPQKVVGKQEKPVMVVANPQDALLNQFRNSVQTSQWQVVMDQSEFLLKEKNLSYQNLSEVYWGREKAFEATEFYLNLLNDFNTQLSNPVFLNDQNKIKQKGVDLILNRMLKPDLEKASNSELDSIFLSTAFFRLGQISIEEKDTDLAKRYYSKSFNLSPTSEIGLKSKDLLEQLEASKKVEAKTIGVVLPMSGKFAAVSKKTLRGIQMGLGLSDQSSSSFKLAVVDSEGNPENARRGVERLVKEDNVIAIIGSVLSKTSSAVASKASELGVPSITLSQKSGVTETSQNVFRNSLTSEMQVRHLVKTAMEDFKMKRFAILFPNDQYGVEFTNIFWDEVLARGGTISSAQTYSTKETDFRFPIQRLIGTYYIEDRADEYKYRLKEWTLAQAKKSSRVNPPDDLLPPVVDFDAIFIPDNIKSLGQIAAMLSYNGVKGGIKLLGTNLWNVPGLSKRVGNWTRDLLFVDSFVNSDPAFKNSRFVKDYRVLFNEEPGIFEIQGYDSAALVRQLVSNGATSRESLSASLAKVTDFPASLGKLSMSIDREIQRPIVMLTLENSEIVPVKRQ